MKSKNLWDFPFERKKKTKSFCLTRNWKSTEFLNRTDHSGDRYA